MIRVLSVLFFSIFVCFGWSQETVFQGRFELGRDLASFSSSPPVKGTLYLLAGAADAVHIVSEEPFVAQVDFIQGEWKDESSLVAYRVLLRFEGAAWAQRIFERKPRTDFDQSIFPHRKFQVAALAGESGFRVLSVTAFF